MSPAKMHEAILKNLPEKTGKTMEEWRKIIQASGLTQHQAILGWLKQEYHLTTGYAQMIAFQYRQAFDYYQKPLAEIISDQYSGEKSGLRPIFDRLAGLAQTLGSDIEIGGRKTYVAFSRTRQFAIIQPSTKDRIDLGLVLPANTAISRLKPAGSFGSGRITHKVSIKSLSEVDEEIAAFLKSAYLLAAKEK